ncbi:MAG: YybS family protein [Treponema sp.]|nr:YybS family protein [Treponema sp.]
MPIDAPLRPQAAKKKELVPALVGAGLCLFFSRSGPLAFFFLLPLGFLAFRHGSRAAWSALFFAVAGNTFITLGAAVTLGIPAAGVVWGVLYFTVMALAFTWVTCAPPGFRREVCTTVRLVTGSCLAALFLAGMFLRATSSPAFVEHISGSAMMRTALLSGLTAEAFVRSVTSVVLRGGALVSSALLFFLCRQVCFILARLFNKNRSAQTQPAAGFHAPVAVIWVLSGSLLMVVLASMASLEIPEIVLWNILTFCGILYFVQGMGILQWFLARPAVTPLLRLLFCVLFVVLVFSPGINVVLIGGVVLLGIAENWVPFRAPKSNGPPFTPQAGDGGN